ncbi:TIM barrel protein [Desulfotomaculum nigrificans]|uniref:TIM barrel protein n=1 Tax=Desulfotomaculum nigrificans TaxID=1565 RepID=UPI0001FAEC96|nr:TIM barrel protein [Desulfotomaculum nigrificans]
MIKSVCIETIFTEAPFKERFQLARQSGFKYIEFWSRQDKNIEQIKHLCEEYDLKVASFSGDESFSMIAANESEQYIEFVEESINVAKYLSCDYLVIHSNALGEGGVVLNDYKEISGLVKFTTMYNILNTLAPIAEKAKVTLVLEALNTKVDHAGNFLAYTKDAAELIKMVNSPFIKILYDVYHMQIMEGNLIDNIKRYIDCIGYIHIADVPGRQEPGTGEINYTNILQTVKSLNFTGVVGFELYPSRNSSEVAQFLANL